MNKLFFTISNLILFRPHSPIFCLNQGLWLPVGKWAEGAWATHQPSTIHCSAHPSSQQALGKYSERERERRLKHQVDGGDRLHTETERGLQNPCPFVLRIKERLYALDIFFSVLINQENCCSKGSRTCYIHHVPSQPATTEGNHLYNSKTITKE